MINNMFYESEIKTPRITGIKRMEGNMVDKSNIKDKLSQYEDIKKEISELESKIEKLEKKGLVIGAVEESRHKPPFGKHSILIEATNPELMNKAEEYKNLLQIKLNNLFQIKIEVEEYINSIPNSRLRRIFRLRYINQYSWRKISYIIGGKATERSVRAEHERFLQEN